jgi:hypothetical protein
MDSKAKMREAIRAAISTVRKVREGKAHPCLEAYSLDQVAAWFPIRNTWIIPTVHVDQPTN